MLGRAKKRLAKLRRIRKRWWILSGLALFLVVSVGSVEVTSHSNFCGSCHIMEPFHESWEIDPHRTVECIECHIPPGMNSLIAAKLNGAGQVVDDFLNRVSMKPSASVSNFACMRSGCHVREELITPPTAERSYLFDHEKHLDLDVYGIAMGCSTCHSHIRGEKHFEVNTNACVVCHLGKVDESPDHSILAGIHGAAVPTLRPVAASPAQAFTGQNGAGSPETHVPDEDVQLEGAALVPPTDCASCHEAPKEPFEHEGLTINHPEFLEYGAACASCHYGVTSRPPPIDDERCYRCHVFGVDRWTEIEEMHDVHTTGERKVECFECHGWIEHGPEAQATAISQFECTSCHSDQHMIQRNAYTQSIPSEVAGNDLPQISPMFLTHIGCPACHIKPRAVSVNPTSGATVAIAVPEACDACHNEGFGDRMIPLWQTSTQELYDSVVGLLPTDGAAQRALSTEARALVDEARSLIELVKLDGSWGVHNPGYTQRLLESARDKLVRANALGAEEEGGTP